MTVKHDFSDIDEKILTDWWYIFNHWGWPHDYAEEIPDNWYGMHVDDKHDIIDPILRAIERVCGHKNLLRRWNSNMTDDEFEEFWQATYVSTYKQWLEYRKKK